MKLVATEIAAIENGLTPDDIQAIEAYVIYGNYDDPWYATTINGKNIGFRYIKKFHNKSARLYSIKEEGTDFNIYFNNKFYRMTTSHASAIINYFLDRDKSNKVLLYRHKEFVLILVFY